MGKEYYDEISKGYDELYGEEQLAKWKIAKELILFSKEDVVLDHGCGTGLLIPDIAKQVKRVIGIDYSIGMLQKAPKLENVIYVLSDADQIPFPDKYFDKTISLTVLQDIKNWDSVLKEIKRVTKGEVLISILKRNKELKGIETKLSKFFKIKKAIEEEKDFMFLLN